MSKLHRFRKKLRLQNNIGQTLICVTCPNWESGMSWRLPKKKNRYLCVRKYIKTEDNGTRTHKIEITNFRNNCNTNALTGIFVGIILQAKFRTFPSQQHYFPLRCRCSSLSKHTVDPFDIAYKSFESSDSHESYFHVHSHEVDQEVQQCRV